MMDFVTMGNDCPAILKYNFNRLNQIYPTSSIFLYDWGHSTRTLQRLFQLNNNLVVIKWPRAHPGNYMFEKVACIEDCFRKHKDMPLVYLDSDVIINETIDELFDSDEWDIAATWVPDGGYGRQQYGVGTWLNAGVLFINNVRPDNSSLFLSEWLRRCDSWADKKWWLDQVELIRLFSEADVDFSRSPDQFGIIKIDETEIRCKTLHYTVYNFLPEVYTSISQYDPERAKVFHFKSKWRKIKFKMFPNRLRAKWIKWMKTSYSNNKLLEVGNLGFNAMLRFILAQGKG